MITVLPVVQFPCEIIGQLLLLFFLFGLYVPLENMSFISSQLFIEWAKNGVPSETQTHNGERPND